MCLCSDIPINQLDEDLFSEEEKEYYLNAVWLGIIDKNNLSVDYHEKHADKLYEPVVQYVGDPEQTIKEVKREVARSMRTNVYEFSAAKQYQQAREMSSLITPEITRKDFIEAANRVFDGYNKNYLATEYNTAIAGSQGANSFIDAVENIDEFPLAQYKTQKDGLVRDAHRPLHNITLPVTHPFWDRFWGDNGWNCRCYQITKRGGKTTDLNTVDMAKINEGVPTLFRRNPAKTGELFDKSKHPYWDVARGDSKFRDQNFNLSNGE